MRFASSMDTDDGVRMVRQASSSHLDVDAKSLPASVASPPESSSSHSPPDEREHGIGSADEGEPPTRVDGGPEQQPLPEVGTSGQAYHSNDSDSGDELLLGEEDEGRNIALALEEDSATCLWGDCGIVFTHLPTLIQHIHNDHIGVHKSNYTCEWSTCQRRGLAQTSRFALVSHIRSHTGEKPFTCILPECDKSFTRSDALAKHMRLQHNIISQPTSGRGGSRKRKRGAAEETPSGTPQNQPDLNMTRSGSGRSSPPPITTTSTLRGTNTTAITNGAFTTFKLEPSYPDPNPYPSANVPANGLHQRSPSPPLGQRRQRNRRREAAPIPAVIQENLANAPLQNGVHPAPASVEEEDTGYLSSSSDTIPEQLVPHFDAETGLVLGRTPAMILYLLAKAKHRYALQERDNLAEELRLAKAELRRESEEKERALDLVLGKMFGPQADMVVGHVQPPPSMTVNAAGALVINGPPAGQALPPLPILNGNSR